MKGPQLNLLSCPWIHHIGQNSVVPGDLLDGNCICASK